MVADGGIGCDFYERAKVQARVYGGDQDYPGWEDDSEGGQELVHGVVRSTRILCAEAVPGVFEELAAVGREAVIIWGLLSGETVGKMGFCFDSVRREFGGSVIERSRVRRISSEHE